MTPLDFQRVRDAGSESWARSHPDRALIEPRSLGEWLVMLPGGEPHVVALERDHDALVGRCDCKGFEFRDSDETPCAHLCAVRRAAWDNETGLSETTDTFGEPIRLVDAEQERADHYVERARADGGSEVRR